MNDKIPIIAALYSIAGVKHKKPAEYPIKDDGASYIEFLGNDKERMYLSSNSEEAKKEFLKLAYSEESHGRVHWRFWLDGPGPFGDRKYGMSCFVSDIEWLKPGDLPGDDSRP